MGQTQANNSAPKKTEEQIREDMRRKWDNFGASQTSKNLQEENNKKSEENKEVSPSIEDKKEEKNTEEVKKPVLLSLKPRE